MKRRHQSLEINGWEVEDEGSQGGVNRKIVTTFFFFY